MAQLVASMPGVVLGGVAEVVGSNLARRKIFTAYISSVDLLNPFGGVWDKQTSYDTTEHLELTMSYISCFCKIMG